MIHVSWKKYDKFPVATAARFIIIYFRKETESEWTRCENRREAASKTGVSEWILGAHVTTERVTFIKGYYFKQEDRQSCYASRIKQHISYTIPIILTNSVTKEIIEFNSLLEAAEKLNLYQSSIRSCLAGNYKSTKGWTVKFKNNEMEEKNVKVSKYP